ncbi:MAG: LPS export ABC transporter permease LptF [Methylobacteriaceae bacterium]|nr:LPS export ABC transporter permease LptF [Methylobacteriaceae bacterium]
MSIAERYIFRIAFVAFLAALVGLTTVIWLTQALREFDLLTTKGQSVVVFLAVTGLTLPSLAMLIAPFALFGASLYALNRLNGDSELIVMSAAGLSPVQLLRPFLALALLVSLLVGTISLWLMPASFREIRDLVTKIRADFLTRVVREGTFTTLDLGFVFHYRDRGPGGELRGVFMQDRRDPARISSYLAEVGQTVEIDGQNYLVLDKGSVQRQQPNSRDVAIIVFERYAIDLAQFAAQGEDSYKPRERSTRELLTLDPKDPQVQRWPGRFRSELHDRFANPLYPLAAVLIAFAALGQARTTRQGRGAAVFAAVLAFGLLRLAGVGATTMAARSAVAAPLMYLAPLLAAAVAAGVIVAPNRASLFGGFGARLAGTLTERLGRLAARSAR